MTVSALPTLQAWDYALIGVYAVLVVSVGFYCRRLNKNSSAYFRGGGNMLWWIGGISAFSTSISAWSFTGGAGKCYLDGFAFPLSQVLSAVPTVLLLLLIAPRFRRTRVVTAMDAVFRRFGLGTEQFYTWILLPMGIFWGGIGVNTLGVFMAGVFHLDLTLTVFVFGVLLTLVAAVGGQWAISFFAVVQGVLLILIVILVSVFTLMDPRIGGLLHLPEVLPERHLDPTFGTSAALVYGWIVWNILFTTMASADMRNSGKFVRVKDDSSARKMAIVSQMPYLLLMPFLIQIPSMCAAVLYPDLAAVFPNLKRPEEGAWLAMALTVLPQGLIGVMVCAMFGASADSTDAALNANAGFFTRNVVLRFLPNLPENRILLVAKSSTVFFGFLVVGVALMVNSLRELNLFDLFQVVNALLLPPMIVPMALGLFVRRTPDWAGWVSVLAGFLAGLLARHYEWTTLIQRIFGIDRTPLERELIDGEFIIISAITLGASAACFALSMALGKSAPSASRARVDSLFEDFQRPVDHLAEGGEDQDSVQLTITGAAAAILGFIMLLCVFIPNPPSGRMGFFFIGAVLSAMGWPLIRRAGKRRSKNLPASH